MNEKRASSIAFSCLLSSGAAAHPWGWLLPALLPVRASALSSLSGKVAGRRARHSRMAPLVSLWGQAAGGEQEGAVGSGLSSESCRDGVGLGAVLLSILALCPAAFFALLRFVDAAL